MKEIMYIFLVFSLLAGGLVIQTKIGDLNKTSWNFTGNGLVRGFVDYIGAFLMLVGIGAVIVKAIDEKRGG